VRFIIKECVYCFWTKSKNAPSLLHRRFCSIASHIFSVINENAKDKNTWTRSRGFRALVAVRYLLYALCVISQVLVLVAVAARFGFISQIIGPTASSVESRLAIVGDGLCRNCAGHASYMLLRAARYVNMVKRRDHKRAESVSQDLPFDYPFWSGYGIYPLAEAEVVLLTAGAFVLLLAPSTLH